MENLFCKEDLKCIDACLSEYRLLPWLDIDKLESCSVYKNPGSIHFLEKEVLKGTVDWELLSLNCNAVYLLEKKMEEELKENKATLSINLNALCCLNHNAIHLIDKLLIERPSEIKWSYLSYNINSDKLKQKSPYKSRTTINTKYWEYVRRSSGLLIHVLELEKSELEYPFYVMNWDVREQTQFEKLKTKIITESKEKDYNKYLWPFLYINPFAIKLIEDRMKKDPDNIDWINLCYNPNAIHLVYEQYKKNPKSINMSCLSMNPSIFKLE
jgi:hypothetical protein